MRHLILTTAAILLIAGAATTSASATHHHHSAAPVAADPSASPADTMGTHAAYLKNLHDAGYDAHKDMDANGNVRQN